MKSISRKSSLKNKYQSKMLAVMILLAFGVKSIAAGQASGQPTNTNGRPQVGESVVSANQHIKIVPTLGYTYFNIQGSSMNVDGAETSFKSKSGNSAAALVLYPLAQYGIELETGLEYLETNSKIISEFSIFSFDVASFNMSQIAIPLRARYTFNPNSESTHYFVKGGLTPTYLVKAEFQNHITGSSEDMKSEMNSLGLYSQIGFGADWGHEILGGRVHLDLTYNYGITKLFKSADGKSAGFQLQAGYAINL